MPPDIYQTAQLASATVWVFVALSPIFRKTVRSPAGWAFTLFAFSLAIYCILDWFYLGASAAEEALFFVKARGVAVVSAALFLLLSSKWLVVKRKMSDLTLTIPALIMLIVGWTLVNISVTPTDWGFYPMRNMAFYVPWIVYLYAYSMVGLYYLYRGSQDLKYEYRAEYVKVLSIIVSVAGVLVAGFVGNAIFTLSGVRQIPLFSSLLVIPGAAMLIFLIPITREDLSSYVRRAISSSKQVLHVYLIYHGGSLIASRSLESNPAVDEDIFSAVLDAIQRFLKISFPALGAGWLDAIDHGDLKILLERGNYCFLVLVTAGRQDDLLRGEMKDVLSRFEEKNAQGLEHWNGDPDTLKGAQEAVNLFFDLTKVF
ncbi:MAG: hypothetical protein ACE5HJ_03020 [Thermoplasmata archaeon]